jgi:hypothetical protein
MDYLKLLENSYKELKDIFSECPPENRLDYLGDYIFNFTTYDSDISILFATKAAEVCDAITRKVTFDYIKNPDNYQWYLIMCNFPFFADRIEWGTSIRGAWWDVDKVEFETCGLWDGANQLTELKFTNDEWQKFIAAIVEFSRLA